ncbi:hypothetical protein Tco_0524620 [Tanacetum coccineum]
MVGIWYRFNIFISEPKKTRMDLVFGVIVVRFAFVDNNGYVVCFYVGSGRVWNSKWGRSDILVCYLSIQQKRILPGKLFTKRRAVVAFTSPTTHQSYEWIRAQVDQGSQIKMIQVKEMMQDNDLKNSKSKDKGSKSRSQSMDEQSHYKQDKTITRQSINVKRHIFNVIGGTEEFEERDLNIGGDC